MTTDKRFYIGEANKVARKQWWSNHKWKVIVISIISSIVIFSGYEFITDDHSTDYSTTPKITETLVKDRLSGKSPAYNIVSLPPHEYPSDFNPFFSSSEYNKYNDDESPAFNVLKHKRPIDLTTIDDIKEHRDHRFVYLFSPEEIQTAKEDYNSEQNVIGFWMLMILIALVMWIKNKCKKA